MSSSESPVPSKRQRANALAAERAPQIAAELRPEERYVDVVGASVVSGLSPGWHHRARIEGIGPRWVKVGNRVRYRVADILEWIESGKAATEHLSPPKRQTKVSK